MGAMVALRGDAVADLGTTAPPASAGTQPVVSGPEGGALATASSRHAGPDVSHGNSDPGHGKPAQRCRRFARYPHPGQARAAAGQPVHYLLGWSRGAGTAASTAGAGQPGTQSRWPGVPGGR